MDKNQFQYFNHLGFHNPYFKIDNGKFNIKSDLAEILDSCPRKTLDFAAVVEILSTGYAFGDRTLVKEIKKTPWMAKPKSDLTDWDFFKLPKHQENKTDEYEVAKHFFKLLEEELLNYVTAHDHIGILLTGGMDSRIVAAVLNQLILKKKISEKKVTAFTWGSLDSRDVVYAKRIAKLYNWYWKHVEVDVLQMQENFDWIVKNGCEFTPLHLHAMSKVAQEETLDCVLGGSFGDSIGRGEYSGIRAKNLKSLDLKIHNAGSILRGDYKTLSAADIQQDIQKYHLLFPEQKAYQQNELDMQLHYMRRMLNPCMSLINKEIPLYQMFSAPEVFSYMWSLHPDCRTDKVYLHILEKYAPELLDIPWARNGMRYLSENETPDQFKKKHHQYGEMIRDHFFELITEKIEEHSAIAAQIFDLKNLKKLLKNCKNYPLKNSFSYEEKLFWIAALLEFIKTHKIKVDLPENQKKDLLNFLTEDLTYKAKFIYKKLK